MIAISRQDCHILLGRYSDIFETSGLRIDLMTAKEDERTLRFSGIALGVALVRVSSFQYRPGSNIGRSISVARAL